VEAAIRDAELSGELGGEKRDRFNAIELAELSANFPTTS